MFKGATARDGEGAEELAEIAQRQRAVYQVADDGRDETDRSAAQRQAPHRRRLRAEGVPDQDPAEKRLGQPRKLVDRGQAKAVLIETVAAQDLIAAAAA